MSDCCAANLTTMHHTRSNSGTLIRRAQRKVVCGSVNNVSSGVGCCAVAARHASLSNLTTMHHTRSNSGTLIRRAQRKVVCGSVNNVSSGVGCCAVAARHASLCISLQSCTSLDLTIHF
ncbi:hypothetical protein J6590_062620 [Homalodisca vitripennis]|nr:hypothetical protein J6590_062620 [Homalodisca vitripennis]